jgi:hypothetical protein
VRHATASGCAAGARPIGSKSREQARRYYWANPDKHREQRRERRRIRKAQMIGAPLAGASPCGQLFLKLWTKQTPGSTHRWCPIAYAGRPIACCDLHPIDRARGNAEMLIRLQHWRNTARKYQRPVINGIALIIVVLCIISLTEMLLITTPIVFGSMVSWLQSLPGVFWMQTEESPGRRFERSPL